MVLLIEYGHHECMSVMDLLCMSISICCYECIFMVNNVVHEVIVGILGHHDVLGMLWWCCVG